MENKQINCIVPQLMNSRVCLVGRLNARQGLKHEELDEPTSQWSRMEMTNEVFTKLQRTYYPSLLTSMNTISGKEIQSVFRYEMQISGKRDNLIYLPSKNTQEKRLYPCEIKNVRLWVFPTFDIILFSIEIEEYVDSFSDLTSMHSMWKKWNEEYDNIHTKELDDLLKPLLQLTNSSKTSDIVYAGTKLRQYQVVESNVLDDDLLYEIGTFSSIGVVNDNNLTRSYKPSNDYYQKIIKENIVSAYSNWKALALNDSFTVLTLNNYYSLSEMDEYDTEGNLKDTGYRYFELLYMRCMFEEYYCFDRNNLYRESDKIDNERIEREISSMEKHYFFDDMSYDFLPPLMYRAMAKGLELQKDREQLTQHIKQSLRETRQGINNTAVNFVQIFAVFSVFWTIRDIILAICPCMDKAVSAIIAGLVSLVCTIILLKWPQFFITFFSKKIK